eukprot:TRINITY_DN14434_c0_g1_i5.p1 TRINITY_DN14434_c0_g1~~TRINITY_DN14434_c0_g1_i5.p1  ORF type:complete len:391 (+),score=82.71 TRINITY_DN14434_c0_g1_i5:109-1281(+)
MPFFESRFASLKPVFIHYAEEHPSARRRSKSYSGYVPYKYFFDEEEADDVMEAEPPRKAAATTIRCSISDSNSSSGSKKEGSSSSGLRQISLQEALSIDASGDASKSQKPCEKRASTSSMPMPPPPAYAAPQFSIADASRRAAPQHSPSKQPASLPPAFAPSAKREKTKAVVEAVAKVVTAGKAGRKAAVAEAVENSPPSSALAVPWEVSYSKPPSPAKRLLKPYVPSPGPSAENHTHKASQERHLDTGSKTLRNFGSRDFPPHVTTVMIRNLPKTIGQQEFLRELDGDGFADSYDFCYVPRNFATNEGQGFAFVNFYRSLEAKRFANAWNRTERFDKVLAVHKADVQGLAANREKWAGGRMLRIRNPAFRPFVREEVSTPQVPLSRSSN